MSTTTASPPSHPQALSLQSTPQLTTPSSPAHLDVTSEVWVTIWAGSDTTAIALTSIFYHLHRHPTTLLKLRAEIDTAFSTGQLTYPVRFSQAIKLPYLHAVCREAMRIHPSLGTGLPRVVPPGPNGDGVSICGKFFPRGLGVIMNQCAVHFAPEIFGEDCEEFVPERWIRDGPEKAAVMERHILQFGYGSRVCIGKHITNIEMYKLLPTILRDFEFEGVGEESVASSGDRKPVKGKVGLLKEWTVWRAWFHQVKGVDVRVKRRREREANTVVPLGEWAFPKEKREV